MDGELEDALRELLDLARRKPLRDEELERAKELMRRLREAGFTNLEVSQLTDGGWSEPTVKLYTRGVTVKDPAPKERAINLLTELVGRGLKLNDVEGYLKVVRMLDAKGIAIGDVLEFLEGVKKAGVKPVDALSMFRGLKDAGLTFDVLKEALTYKAELESTGFTIEGLRMLLDASKRYGGFPKVLEAIGEYGELDAVRAEKEAASAEKSKLEEEVKSLEKRLEDLRRREGEVKGTLKIYEELKGRGFGDDALMELKKASERYGGLREVLEAINSYGEVTSIKSELSKLKEERDGVEADLKKLNADYAHLQTVVGMCEKLLYKYKFSVPAIENLYEVSKRYGEPLEVLKAVGKYGELKALEEDIEKLSAKRGELEARVRELESQIRQMRAESVELRGQIANMYRPLIEEVTKGVGQMRGEFSKVVEGLSLTYRSSQEKLGKAYEESLTIIEGRLAEASRLLGQLEEKVARVKALSTLTNIIESPAEVKQPVGDVLTASLPFIYGLTQYIEINKNEIKSYYELADPLRKLSGDIVKRLRGS